MTPGHEEAVNLAKEHGMKRMPGRTDKGTFTIEQLAALIADVRRQAMEEAAVAAEAKGKHSILCDCTTCLIRHEIAYGIRANPK